MGVGPAEGGRAIIEENVLVVSQSRAHRRTVVCLDRQRRRGGRTHSDLDSSVLVGLLVEKAVAKGPTCSFN